MYDSFMHHWVSLLQPLGVPSSSIRLLLTAVRQSSYRCATILSRRCEGVLTVVRFVVEWALRSPKSDGMKSFSSRQQSPNKPTPDYLL